MELSIELDGKKESRKVPMYGFKCVNYKCEWEIELNKLEQE